MRTICLAISVLLGFASAAHSDPLSQIEGQIQELSKQRQTLAARLKRAELRQAARERLPEPESAQVAPPAPSAFQALTQDGPLAWRGITFYGGLDAGVAWQSHGAPFNGLYPQGLQYRISKNSNHAGFAFAPNALSYSNLGLKGTESIAPDLAVIFDLNTRFNPGSGMIANGPGSLAQNNGVALTSQSSRGDSAFAGQALNNFAYLGLSSQTFGALTVGRQKSLIADNASAYDPIDSAPAFSVIAGSFAGGGNTENSRLDNVLKYRLGFGQARFAALYQVGAGPASRDAYQFSLGGDVGSLSFDATFSQIGGSVHASSLNASQAATEPAGSLSGTISDNTGIVLAARYTYERFIFFGGYAAARNADPQTTVAPGFSGLGGYVISVTNNSAFQYHDRVRQVLWTGFKYAYDDRLEVAGGFYHALQNSYGKNGCNTTESNTCSGTFDAISGVIVYRASEKFDFYGGLMYSTVANGYASGYLYRNSVDPTVGVRYLF
ncbi:porin [uncultured Rhodoblastus sp.]|uniref:porin n=1 Tax=uncultured Rhodoblastus sp. TaxID=543037 RepID=UPI0025E6A810|nr:porin [uncultured Rhodoblastus sp.]